MFKQSPMVDHSTATMWCLSNPVQALSKGDFSRTGGVLGRSPVFPTPTLTELSTTYHSAKKWSATFLHL